MPGQSDVGIHNGSSSFFCSSSTCTNVLFCKAHRHLLEELEHPTSRWPPPFLLVHPSINSVAASKLVSHIYPTHSIVVIIIYFASKESHLHAFLLLFIENQFNLFNPLQLRTGHQKKVYWLCVIHTEGNKVWAFCNAFKTAAFVSPLTFSASFAFFNSSCRT